MAKTNSIQKTDVNGQIKYILDEFIAGLENILTAAKAYVKLIDEDITFKERLIKAAAARGLTTFGVRSANWLERIGRGEAHWQLLLCQSSGNGSQIRRLPFSEQKAIFEDHKKYPLLLPAGDHIKVDVTQISHDQSKQVFGDGYIRDIGEQKIYLVDNPADSNKPIEAKDEYQILAAGRVRIGDIIFSRKQIQHILLQM